MNKIFLSALALSALLGGCNVLDQEPLTNITPANFFKTATDAESAITAAYDGLQSNGVYGERMNLIGNLPSDDCLNAGGAALDQFTWNASTGDLDVCYRDHFRGINRCNAVLKNVPGISMPETRKNQILAEAKFLRALFYFNLVKTFGGVPLRLDPTETYDASAATLPRATPEAVYDQVVKDLTEAEPVAAVSYGSVTADRARATKGAVNALLARVSLYQRNWAAAAAAAAKVVTNSSYVLASTPKALYPPENNPESVFEVQFSGTGSDGGFTVPDIVLPAPPATYSFPKTDVPTPELLAYVDTTNDLRWKYVGRTIAGRDHVSYVDADRGTGNDAGPFAYKWPGNPGGFNSSDNEYVIRLAEVLLIQAEGLNESGNAAGALVPLNRVRQRAGLPALALTDKQALRNAIDRERRLELAFEGERWFDLVRYTRHTKADPTARHAVTALDVIQQKLNRRDENYLLFPIPIYEINNNTQVTQNPGY